MGNITTKPLMAGNAQANQRNKRHYLEGVIKSVT